MSCCGGKRAQLSGGRFVQGDMQESVAEPEPRYAPPPRERTGRTFVYDGDSTLTVRGAVSGTAYRFMYPGVRLEVAADDVFAMMAEPDLRPETGSSRDADGRSASPGLAPLSGTRPTYGVTTPARALRSRARRARP